MKVRAGFMKVGVCVLTASAALVARAQLDELFGDADDNAGVAATEEAAVQEEPSRPFEPLVRISTIRGQVQVNNPDVGTYTDAAENKLYPMGTRVRTMAESSVFLVFSNEDTVKVQPDTEVIIKAAANNPDAREVTLISGRVSTSLRENMPDGFFNVSTPNACMKSISGRGDYRLSNDGTIETFQAATITGTAIVDGPNYTIPRLRAANTVLIETSPDRALSRLTSTSGDYTINLDNGTEEPVAFDMSPHAIVKIWRENAPVGGRMIVSTLVISPSGKARHRFAFASGRTGLLFGDIATLSDEETEKLDSLLGAGLADDADNEDDNDDEAQPADADDDPFAAFDDL